MASTVNSPLFDEETVRAMGKVADIEKKMVYVLTNQAPVFKLLAHENPDADTVFVSASHGVGLGGENGWTWWSVRRLISMSLSSSRCLNMRCQSETVCKHWLEKSRTKTCFLSTITFEARRYQLSVPARGGHPVSAGTHPEGGWAVILV